MSGNPIRWLLRLALAALIGAVSDPVRCQPPGESSQPAAWQLPSAEEVRSQAFAWLEQNQADPPTKAKASELWSSLPEAPTESELLRCLAQTFALMDSDAANLVERCSHPRSSARLAEESWLSDADTRPLVAHNMRLFYARWLVHQSLLDEARDQLAGLSAHDVVAPASLLFYQAIVDYRLLDKQSGLKAIEQLLDGAQHSPRRYVAIARLMQQDLQSLEDDSLDHISRRMDDIGRRLALGRAGKKVRGIEDGVIESLDKLIEKLEKQQQQCSGTGAGSLQSGRPASDSQILGGKGPGNVTKRPIGSGGGWGDLPPKEREEALQQIGRDFPSHYRDIIEQYFRKLAAEGSE
jgi:hypothetical protein